MKLSCQLTFATDQPGLSDCSEEGRADDRPVLCVDLGDEDLTHEGVAARTYKGAVRLALALAVTQFDLRLGHRCTGLGDLRVYRAVDVGMVSHRLWPTLPLTDTDGAEEYC